MEAMLVCVLGVGMLRFTSKNQNMQKHKPIENMLKQNNKENLENNWFRRPSSMEENRKEWKKCSLPWENEKKTTTK